MKFPRPRREAVEVNVTPLIEVVFLLLSFFMVSTTFETRQALELGLGDRGIRGIAERGQLVAGPIHRVLVADHAERGLIRVTAFVERRAIALGHLVDLFLRG